MITVELPDSLAEEISLLAAAEQKDVTPFITEMLWLDVKRVKQLKALEFSFGAWSLADHPELAESSAAYVRKIRTEPDERFEEAVRLYQAP